MTAIPSDISAFLFHMPDIDRCQRAFQDIHQTWRLIEASAKMNCPEEARLILPSVVATRTELAQLEQDLIANLVHERVKNVLADSSTRARYALDLLVRNLFERTADVGFLAADDVLCAFAAGRRGDADAVRARLAAYRDKYTVYDDILLVAPDGRVLAQLDGAQPVAHSTDPLIAATLAGDGYVETFRASDLRPGQPRALLYSQAMRDPQDGTPVAVLCLSFRFAHEMQAIFSAYGDAQGRANIALLDADGQIIASADPQWLRPGTRLPARAADDRSPLLFCGREYLLSRAEAQPFQGYAGPAGWTCQVMLPLDLAFRGGASNLLAHCAPDLLQGLLSHSQRFNPALHQLMHAVSATTHAIRRIVWNGKISCAGGDNGRLNTVLDQITETGDRSNGLFARSIQDLYQTVLASSMRAAAFTTQLLVDMLDRSLYERANDCRWWALAGPLRAGLADAGEAGQAAMTEVLQHINRLYTVYSRLCVYDASGCIVASTASQDVLGQRIAGATLAQVRALDDEQAFYAAPFGPSPLYGGRPTYVFHAALRHPEHGAFIGGIGIVFDAAHELPNMLQAGLAGRPNMQAWFVTPNGTVLAGTDDTVAPGAILPVDRALLDEVMDGTGGARVLAFRGQYGVAACARAHGYREFRANDDTQPVLAVLIESFGPLRDSASRAPAGGPPRIDAAPGDEAFALFEVGGALMAVAASSVLEALPCERLQRAPGDDPARLGVLDVSHAGRRQQAVWVYDLANLIDGTRSTPDERSQVILVRYAGITLGLLVDDLHSVQQFSARDLVPLVLGAEGLSRRVIKANQGQLLIQELDLGLLFGRLGCARAA